MGPMLVPRASAGGAAGGTYELDTEFVGNEPILMPGASVEAAAGGTYELDTEFVGNLLADELALLLATGGRKHLLA